MLVALVVLSPFALTSMGTFILQPQLILAGIGVGICSSVIPYVADQLAMARLPRASFALFLTLLPAFATVIGIIVLRQTPSLIEFVGITLVISGVALHEQYETGNFVDN